MGGVTLHGCAAALVMLQSELLRRTTIDRIRGRLCARGERRLLHHVRSRSREHDRQEHGPRAAREEAALR
jgi:hypothetical protein